MQPLPPETKPQRRLLRRIVTVAGSAIGVCVVAIVITYLVPAPSIWSKPAVVDASDGGGGLQSISCATTATLCATFNWTGELFIFNGRRWRNAGVELVDQLNEPTDVSCVPAQCMIVDDANDVYVFTGHSLKRTYVNGYGFSSVSCATRTFCAAVDENAELTYNGRTWKSSVVGDQGGGSMNVVDCPSRDFCAAGGDVAMATFDGTSWRAEGLPLPDPADSILQLSCSASSFCVAISSDGDWVRYQHGRWQYMGPFGGGDQSQGYTPRMLSCPAANRCFEASTSGAIYRLDGTRWSDLGYIYRQSIASRFFESIFPTPAVSLSCPTVRNCVAVDGGGMSYRGP